MKLPLVFLILFLTFETFAKPLVIAHRGASGYLPEHTLEAKAMAVAMGSDYVEQDVVMSKDGELIVFHDLVLDRVTNVAEVFPNRHRKDGRFYVIDFSLSELRQLRVTEGRKLDGETSTQIYPERFPQQRSRFSIHTLSEEIELIQGLNHSMKKTVGIYPEIKSPWFHQKEGQDISSAVLMVLKKYGYTDKHSKVLLQSFDANELRRIRFELLPKLKMDIQLIQLVAYTDWQETKTFENGEWVNYDYEWMFSESGLRLIKSYADGIGPWYPMLVTQESTDSQMRVSNWMRSAKNIGLLVHAYTFRSDSGQVPSSFETFAEYVRFYNESVGVDGYFTDFPDQVIDALINDKNVLKAKH